MKDIPGFEGKYAVTEDGKIWSHKKKGHNGIFLVPRDDRKGYLDVNFYGKFYKIHRLVCMTYHPNPNNYPAVRHLDNNKRNNHVSNLEWCTFYTNNKQARDDGLCITTDKMRESGRRNGKLKAKKVVQYLITGEEYKTYNSAIHAHKETGIFGISKCARGEIKHSGGFVWKYV